MMGSIIRFWGIDFAILKSSLTLILLIKVNHLWFSILELFFY